MGQQKFRLEFDSYFAPNSNNGFLHDGELITGLTVYICHIFKDLNTYEEILFTSFEDAKKKGFDFRLFTAEYRKTDGFFVKKYGTKHSHTMPIHDTCYAYYITKCYKDVRGTPIQISEEELRTILKKFPQYFDTLNNKPTQNLSWGLVPYDVTAKIIAL